jgi:aminoglycoside phosphotransferase (APT) family kinase protein
MHADELDVDEPLVRALLTAQFPQWADLPLARVEPSGTDNAMFRLGAKMVVRVPRLAGAVPALLKERTWLPRLAPLLPLAVPVPLAHGTPSGAFPLEWSVYSWVPGEPATAGRIVDSSRAADDLARFLSALQAVETDGAPEPTSDSSRGVPLERRDTSTRTALAQLHGRIDVPAVTAIWEQALRAPAWRGEPVWVHGDLDCRNVLVEDGRLSGVIDFGCLVAGDPACDVMAAWKLFSGESRERFRRLLAVDDATWLRSRGWAASQAVLILAYYTLETNAILVRESERWLDALLTSR